MRAATGAAAPEQRGDDRSEGVSAGQHVRRLQIRDARRGIAVLLEMGHPGHRVNDVRERR